MPLLTALKSLFEYKGDISFINELVGDFAIAFWDDMTKKLYLIRDHFGKKPLYYAFFNDYFFLSLDQLNRIALDESIYNHFYQSNLSSVLFHLED